MGAGDDADGSEGLSEGKPWSLGRVQTHNTYEGPAQLLSASCMSETLPWPLLRPYNQRVA